MKSKMNAIMATAMAMAASAHGMPSNTMVLHPPVGTVAASKHALRTPTAVRRQNPMLLRGAMWKPNSIQGHFYLNQRQRRKYNRQRHANGIKNAFA